MVSPASWLPVTYFPEHSRNRMRLEGNLATARADFLSRRMCNLRFLLRRRYEWMNDFIRKEDIVVEIGAGAGLSKFYIDHERMISTEVTPYPWIDLCTDASALPFGGETIDVIIAANVIHHIATLLKFLRDAQRCLRPGGHLLLVEPNPSLLLLAALRIMRHEGWSFESRIFDAAACVNDPSDPWSGNNAISHLLFRDPTRFARHAPGYEIVRDEFCECLIFALSGGVTAKTRAVQLPRWVLRVIDFGDRCLSRSAPMVFAMARYVALRKTLS
jgi:SAM-dependent methyltransferase